MIQVLCNICSSQIEPNTQFLFEASIVEPIPVLMGGDVNTQTQMQKKVIHICKACYDEKLKDVLYAKKK